MHSYIAPASAAEASIGGLFQLWIVPSMLPSSSPLVVEPVILWRAIADLPVGGSTMPGEDGAAVAANYKLEAYPFRGLFGNHGHG